MIHIGKAKGVLIIDDAENILTIKVILAFLVGIGIIYVTALIIGKENKRKWFKKRQQTSFFNRRGVLGENCHFGYPCTKQGLIVTIVMYSMMALFGYGIIFKL